MSSVPDWQVVGAVAVGAVAGAEARYGVSRAMRVDPGDFPWSTLLINGSGCFLIGVLMVVCTELTTPHPLIRPLLGVGILGGYTTFSTFSEESRALLGAGHTGAALAYLAVTPAVAVLAVWLATALTRTAGRPS